MRLLIIGNCGTGKSWLAKRVAERRARLPILRMDELLDRAEAEGTRTKPRVYHAVSDFALGEHWVIEGTYGDLAAAAATRATDLIWIDLPADECLANIRDRATRARAADPERQARLERWAQDYESRDGFSSRAGHAAIFETFDGQRHHFRSREELERFLETLP